MTALALALVAAAVLLWPGGRAPSSPGADPGPAGPGRSGSPPAPAGAKGLQSLLRSRVGPGGGGTSTEDWVADLAEVTAVGLRAGLDLRSAALVGARTPVVAGAAPWLQDRLAAASGAGPASCLLAAAATLPQQQEADLAVLARAWRLSETTGAAASRTTSAAASAVRSRTAARERSAAALAGPRASMRLLTALPLAGPLIGLVLGLDPVALYGSLPAAAATVAGLVLTALGWWWSATSIARASRPGLTAPAR